jgi:uncharacterized membrane protein
LLFVVAIFIGGFIPNIPLGGRWSINIGGALIPFALCVFLWAKAGTGKEKARAIIAAILAATAVYFAGRLLPAEPTAMIFDPHYIYGILCGLIAYLLGRSRRSAFIAGTMGILLADTAQGVINTIRGVGGPVALGGAGALRAVVISGVLAVLLAEVFGELRERMQGGSAKNSTQDFDRGEFVPVEKGKRHD